MKLQRNAGKVLAALSDLPNKPVIAKAPITIHFPVRFREVELAQIGASTFTFGLFAMILDSGDYALCNANAFFELGPASVEIIEVQEVEYYSFRFEAGDVVFKTKDLICRANLIYKAIEEFMFKGKIPYYVDYDDMGMLFDTAKKHARTSADILPAVVEFMAAYIARSPENRILFAREKGKTYADFEKKNVAWVPLRSVYWSAPGTVNKLAGAYFQEGVVSALVNPSENEPNIEKILRA